MHHSVVATRSAISVTESVRTGLERRSILPGSPIITATSKTPSTIGTPQRGRTMRLCGSSSVSTMTVRTAAAIGQRASPITGCTFVDVGLSWATGLAPPLSFGGRSTPPSIVGQWVIPCVDRAAKRGSASAPTTDITPVTPTTKALRRGSVGPAAAASRPKVDRDGADADSPAPETYAEEGRVACRLACLAAIALWSCGATIIAVATDRTIRAVRSGVAFSMNAVSSTTMSGVLNST